MAKRHAQIQGDGRGIGDIKAAAQRPANVSGAIRAARCCRACRLGSRMHPQHRCGNACLASQPASRCETTADCDGDEAEQGSACCGGGDEYEERRAQDRAHRASCRLRSVTLTLTLTLALTLTLSPSPSPSPNRSLSLSTSHRLSPRLCPSPRLSPTSQPKPRPDPHPSPSTSARIL